MGNLNEIDLGATILSLALAAGFVAFAILIIRLVISGISSIISRFKKEDFSKSTEVKRIKGEKQ